MKKLLPFLLLALLGCGDSPTGARCHAVRVEVSNLYFDGRPVQSTLVEREADCRLLSEEVVFENGWPFVKRNYTCVVCKEDL